MKPLLDRQSRIQRIYLEQAPEGHLILYLDGFIQFDTRFEDAYHEFLADVPMMLAKQIRTVLIMGGGDGLAAREILNHSPRRVFNIELDPEMVAVAKSKPIVDLNRGSFTNKRVRVIMGDAYRWVKKLPPAGFDVVIADFPANTNWEIAKLYSRTFYKKVRCLVAPGGIFVTQVSEGAVASERIRRILAELFGHAATLRAELWKGLGEEFVYASDEPFTVRRSGPPRATIAARRIQDDSAKGLTDIVIGRVA